MMKELKKEEMKTIVGGEAAAAGKHFKDATISMSVAGGKIADSNLIATLEAKHKKEIELMSW